ncbi:MAG: hypothetical protein ACI83W_001516 [Marinoscillum sp.]|jgi:hypothetical protein
MKKFKLIFYPIYIVAALLILIFGLEILANMESYKEKFYSNLFSQSGSNLWSLKYIPYYLMGIFLFLGTLMSIEWILENFQLMELRRKLKKAEGEVLHYKAKLYDLTQKPIEEEEPEEKEESDYKLDNED